MTEPWFDPNRFGALFGAIVGGGGGTFLGLVGAAAGILLPRGRGQTAITVLLGVGAVIGACSGAFGLYALMSRQPFGIWYPPLLTALIFMPICIMQIFLVKRATAMIERRKMEARDLREV